MQTVGKNRLPTQLLLHLPLLIVVLPARARGLQPRPKRFNSLCNSANVTNGIAKPVQQRYL